MTKYFELKGNEDIAHQGWWCHRISIWRKIYNTKHFIKKERSLIDDPSFFLRKLERKEQMKCETSRRKEIITHGKAMK